MKFFINIFFLFYLGSSIAQIDKKNVPLNLKLDNPFKESPANQSNLPSLEFKSIFDTENKPNRYSILPKTEEKTKSILEENPSQFKNPGDEIKNKMNKEIEKEGSWVDVFYGRIIVYTPTIKIKVRDFGEVDGDRVQVILNEFVAFPNLLLEGYYSQYYTIDLRLGDNFMNVLALNQGLVGDNTANFVIYDGNGVKVAEDEWFLKKGVKEKFIIEYRKPLEDSK